MEGSTDIPSQTHESTSESPPKETGAAETLENSNNAQLSDTPAVDSGRMGTPPGDSNVQPSTLDTTQMQQLSLEEAPARTGSAANNDVGATTGSVQGHNAIADEG